METWPNWLRGGGARIVLAAGTALGLALMAPWNSGTLAFGRRAGEFLFCALAWEAALVVVFRAVRRRWGNAAVEQPLGLLACCTVAFLPATSAMAALFALLGDGPGPLPAFYAQSLLLGLVIAFARRGLRRNAGKPGAAASLAPAPVLPPMPAPGPADDPARAFLRRHAPALSASRLLALQSEDHYLRIHAEAGSTLVLLRLRDAMAELEGLGWQPHRSFWLAHDAGGRAERRGQAWQVVLENGLAVPVSKPAVPAMRAAGYASAA